jgi:hypothetical protein
MHTRGTPRLMNTMPKVEQRHHDTQPSDPFLGDEETVPGTIVEEPILILELSLTPEETRVLSAASAAANMSLPRYLLRAAMQSAQHELGLAAQ